MRSGDVPGARANLEASEKSETRIGESELSSFPAREHLPAPKAKARDVLWARALLSWASHEPEEARPLLELLAASEADADAVWFDLGGVALEEARAYSRQLFETAPDSTWNRRLEAEAVTVRYPDLARELLPDSRRPMNATSEAPSGLSTSARSGTAAREPTHPSPQEDVAEVLYLKARSALRLSQEAYGRASSFPRFNAYLHAMKALAAEEQNDDPAAQREYQTGLAEDPQSALLHAGLGHLYRQRLNLQAAEPELERARQLDPSDAIAAFELGDVYERLGKAHPALDMLNRALQLDPSLLVARWSRGKTYLALGDNERALADLEGAASADSTGELQWQLSRLYLKLGRADLAAAAEKRSEEQRKAVGTRQ